MYSNTVLYTDNFLKQVYSYAIENLNLKVMVYIPDHGEDVKLGHHPKYVQRNQVAIPMFIYCSTSYKLENPEVIKNLLSHQNSYFTNDMMYNTLCGLMDVKSNYYDNKEDLTSLSYAFNKQNTFSHMGLIPLTDKRIAE